MRCHRVRSVLCSLKLALQMGVHVYGVVKWDICYRRGLIYLEELWDCNMGSL